MIAYLKNHAAQLSGQQQLLALSDQRVDRKVLSHIFVIFSQYKKQK